ncbi:glycoside hydrolase superfamily [Xylaria acuta]|nr:glycoside hydrolase superfamily [Xylaria acuta]
MGEFGITNKSISLNSGNPNKSANDWFWDEIKTVQDAGVKVSMWFLHQAITDHSFDGIDLDIEDGQSSCSDKSMNLNDTDHLLRRLRADFGPDFIITSAPVSNALLDEGSVSCFSYRALERRAASNISWYNYERCINEGGWKPERIVTTITTSSDFTYPLPRSSWVGLNETGPTIETLAQKYANFGGVGGFEYHDAEPGGYEHPWQWSRWAARRMGV